MKKILLAIIFLNFIISCKPKSEFKTLDFGDFEITVPQQWNELEFKGIDSYVGGIITPEKDSLIFDLGRYSSDITKNSLPLVFDKKGYAELTKKEKELLKKTKYLVVDSLSGDIDFGKYPKYKTVYYQIDCFKAKIITPTNIEFGSTGVYIDSLKGSSKDFTKTGMCFYGYNLRKKTQEEFVKALKTIRFKEYCNQDK